MKGRLNQTGMKGRNTSWAGATHSLTLRPLGTPVDQVPSSASPALIHHTGLLVANNVADNPDIPPDTPWIHYIYMMESYPSGGVSRCNSYTICFMYIRRFNLSTADIFCDPQKSILYMHTSSHKGVLNGG